MKRERVGEQREGDGLGVFGLDHDLARRRPARDFELLGLGREADVLRGRLDAAPDRAVVQGRLGLRTAGENNADAVVRGKVTRYDPDVPLSFQAGQGRTDVTQRQVSITVDVEILDQREGKTLWQRQGLSEVGEYRPPQEADGRKIALQKLVRDLVDGAQSQW